MRSGFCHSNSSMRITLVASSLLLVSISLVAEPLVVGSPERSGLAPDRLARISAEIEANVAHENVIGAAALIYRRGQVAYFETRGQADRKAGRAISEDTIYRIYSMSKPITSVALMTLFEEGKFRLKDPVSKYIPELGGLKVLEIHNGNERHVPAHRDMTVQDLLRHTSGLTYGLFAPSAVDRLYAKDDILDQTGTLRDMVVKLGKLPLKHHPGEAWEYSVSVDVQARLVEVLSGERFDRFLATRIFEPLGMTDSRFHVEPADRGRFAEMYVRDGDEGLKPAPADQSERFLDPDAAFYMGGGGLVSTMGDYLRFCRMLLNGGELDGARLLSPTTIALMTRDHVPARAKAAGVLSNGYGFGLGFAVHNDPARSGSASSVGEYNWGGLAGTKFWIDPAQDMIGIYMVQNLPPRRVETGNMFKQFAYQAIVD